MSKLTPVGTGNGDEVIDLAYGLQEPPIEGADLLKRSRFKIEPSRLRKNGR